MALVRIGDTNAIGGFDLMDCGATAKVSRKAMRLADVMRPGCHYVQDTKAYTIAILLQRHGDLLRRRQVVLIAAHRIGSG